MNETKVPAVLEFAFYREDRVNKMKTKPHAMLEVSAVPSYAQKGKRDWGSLGQGGVAVLNSVLRAHVFENTPLIKNLKVVRNFSKTSLEEEHSRPWAWPMWLRQREKGKN